jgi:hypothetical protein
VPLSFGIAAVSPFNTRQPLEIAWLKSVLVLPWMPAAVQGFLERYLSGDSILSKVGVRTTICLGLLTLATIAAVYASVLLVRCAASIRSSTITLIWRLSILIGLVNVAAYPMFTQDLWASVVWGRMLAAGENPFYAYFSSAGMAGTPLYFWPTFMTYGPLWGWIAALAVLLSAGSIVVTYVFTKVVLLAAWLLALWVVRAALAGRPALHQAGAMCFFGWWPVSVHFAIGEGHNDIAMAAMLMVWAYLSSRQKHGLSLVALAASILIKYASAPLAAVAIWDGVTLRGRQRWWWVAGVAGGLSLTLLVCVPVVRDWQFIQSTVGLQGWNFLNPWDAVGAVLRKFGLPPLRLLLSTVVRIVFAAATVYYAVQFVRTPRDAERWHLVLAIVACSLFAFVGHVWPWFLIWTLGPAAVVGRGPFCRLIVAAAVVAPFLDGLWLAAGGWEALPVAGVLFYGAVFLIVISPRWWPRLEWGRL